jgi:hypothetical protein
MYFCMGDSDDHQACLFCFDSFSFRLLHKKTDQLVNNEIYWFDDKIVKWCKNKKKWLFTIYYMKSENGIKNKFELALSKQFQPLLRVKCCHQLQCRAPSLKCCHSWFEEYYSNYIFLKMQNVVCGFWLLIFFHVLILYVVLQSGKSDL